MRFRMTILLTVLLLLGLCGCSMEGMDQQLDAAKNAVAERWDRVKDTLEQAGQTVSASASGEAAAGALTREQAEAIALEHAGFTADQVTNLRTEYEIDNGIPRYEVQFRQGRWEYDYEINAETGGILSYDRDD